MYILVFIVQKKKSALYFLFTLCSDTNGIVSAPKCLNVVEIFKGGFLYLSVCVCFCFVFLFCFVFTLTMSVNMKYAGELLSTVSSVQVHGSWFPGST